jgi:hypothetical protein
MRSGLAEFELHNSKILITVQEIENVLAIIYVITIFYYIYKCNSNHTNIDCIEPKCDQVNSCSNFEFWTE